MSVLFSVLGCVLYSIGHRFPPIRQPVLVRPDAKTWSQTAGAVQATSRHGWRRIRCDCRAAPSSLTAIAALHSRAWAGASVPPRRLSRRRGWCMRYWRKKSEGALLRVDALVRCSARREVCRRRRTRRPTAHQTQISISSLYSTS